MSTNEFARILLTWIKSFLSWIGIPRDRLNELDEIIFLILIVVIAFAVGAVFHYLSVRFTRKVLKYKNISFLSDYPFMHLLYSQLLVCQRVCLQNTVCLICK